MKISVRGIGWVSEEKCGCVRLEIVHNHQGGVSLRDLMKQESLFRHKVRYYGRFDDVSKLTCCAVALALHDAGLAESQERRIGILGTSAQGCLPANLEYFQDYVDSGRTTARGNLFIYTLPSSPLAEVAIHFGLHGPLFFINALPDGGYGMLAAAGGIVSRGEAPGMLAVSADERKAFCLVIGEAAPGRDVCGLDDALKLLAATPGGDAVINALASMSKK